MLTKWDENSAEPAASRESGYASSVSPQEICAFIGTTAAGSPAEVFLCGAKCPPGHIAAGGRHDPKPGADPSGPLRGREK